MNSINPFPAELRTASIVPRWSVVWTLNKDTIANHSYFVAMYAHQIANLLRWNKDRGRLMFLALTHDLDETATGDIVSPVKRIIVDSEKYEEYARLAMLERMQSIAQEMEQSSPYDDEINHIITAADRLDALLFLIVEERMGNKHVFSRARDAYDRFKEAWYGMSTMVPEFALENLMTNVIGPAIEEHKRFGGSGV